MADILPFAPPAGGAPPPAVGGAPNPAALAALSPKPPAAAPGNLGPVTTPQPNMGNSVKAMSDIRNAVKMLESALPNIPMGSPLHAEILNSTKSIIKHLQQGDGSAGLDLMSLLQMARGASQAQPMQALMKAFPNQPNAPPALPVTPPAAPSMAA